MDEKNCGLGVHIVYRNDRMEVVDQKDYTLEAYTEMIRASLFQIVSDVEELAYEANDNKPREQWMDETWRLFSRIKHRLLDHAGDIGRLPDTVYSREGRSWAK